MLTNLEQKSSRRETGNSLLWIRPLATTAITFSTRFTTTAMLATGKTLGSDALQEIAKNPYKTMFLGILIWSGTTEEVSANFWYEDNKAWRNRSAEQAPEEIDVLQKYLSGSQHEPPYFTFMNPAIAVNKFASQTRAKWMNALAVAMYWGIYYYEIGSYNYQKCLSWTTRIPRDSAVMLAVLYAIQRSFHEDISRLRPLMLDYLGKHLDPDGYCQNYCLDLSEKGCWSTFSQQWLPVLYIIFAGILDGVLGAISLYHWIGASPITPNLNPAAVFGLVVLGLYALMARFLKNWWFERYPVEMALRSQTTVTPVLLEPQATSSLGNLLQRAGAILLGPRRTIMGAMLIATDISQSILFLNTMSTDPCFKAFAATGVGLKSLTDAYTYFFGVETNMTPLKDVKPQDLEAGKLKQEIAQEIERQIYTMALNAVAKRHRVEINRQTGIPAITFFRDARSDSPPPVVSNPPSPEPLMPRSQRFNQRDTVIFDQTTAVELARLDDEQKSAANPPSPDPIQDSKHNSRQALSMV